MTTQITNVGDSGTDPVYRCIAASESTCNMELHALGEVVTDTTPYFHNDRLEYKNDFRALAEFKDAAESKTGGWTIADTVYADMVAVDEAFENAFVTLVQGLLHKQNGVDLTSTGQDNTACFSVAFRNNMLSPMYGLDNAFFDLDKVKSVMETKWYDENEVKNDGADGESVFTPTQIKEIYQILKTSNSIIRTGTPTEEGIDQSEYGNDPSSSREFIRGWSDGDFIGVKLIIKDVGNFKDAKQQSCYLCLKQTSSTAITEDNVGFVQVYDQNSGDEDTETDMDGTSLLTGEHTARIVLPVSNDALPHIAGAYTLPTIIAHDGNGTDAAGSVVLTYYET